MNEEQVFVNPKELSKITGRNARTLIEMAKRREIPGAKKGGRWMFHKDRVVNSLS